MQHPGGPFKIIAINDWVPEKLKPWIIILFVLVFQFAGGGVYLATLNEVMSDNALMQEDILMAGYAALIGTALTFTIMLRLKLRFISKHIFLFCCSALIACNLICLYTTNIFVLVGTCFIAGILRMWATFECNSTIQLWITPKRDLSIFFCFVYLVVQGSILLSGSAQMYITFMSTWQYVHWVVIALLLSVMLFVTIAFNSIRFIPKMPLFGVDWLGMFMWGLSLLCLNFIAVYGEHYDWWDSKEICIASFFFLALLGLNLLRASFIRHPFIPLPTFRYPVMYLSFIAYVLIDFFIAPSHLFEEIYLNEILKYDVHHTITMNWIGFAGVVCACVFTLFYFAIPKRSYKSTLLIGFSAIITYLMMMYFLLDYNTSTEVFGLAIFLRNFGYVIIAIVMITSLTKIPFPHFFQAISVQAFVSAASGAAVTGAVLHYWFNHVMTKNFQFLTMGMDHLNYELHKIPQNHLTETLIHQSMMMSFKEIYGYMIILALICFALFSLYKYPYLPKNTFYPKGRTIRKILKREYFSKAKSQKA